MLDLGFTQDNMNDVHASGCGDTVITRPPFDLRIGEDAIDGGLALRSVHLQIVHDQNAFAFDLEINKRVGRDEFGGVIQVRIEFACRDEDCGFMSL